MSMIGIIRSRVPSSYAIAITDIICFLPLAKNDSDTNRLATEYWPEIFYIVGL